MSIFLCGSEELSGYVRVKSVEIQEQFQEIFNGDSEFVAVLGTAEYRRNVKLLTNFQGQYITFGDDLDMLAISILYCCKVVCLSTTKQSGRLTIVRSFPPQSAEPVLSTQNWPEITLAHFPSPDGEEDHFDLLLPHNQVSIAEASASDRTHCAAIWKRALAA